MEGTRYRLKSPGRVVAEIKHVLEVKEPKRFTFCENNFNVPRPHAEAICQEIIDQGLSISWGSGDLRPLGVTEDSAS